jgi:hypothetical protein
LSLRHICLPESNAEQDLGRKEELSNSFTMQLQQEQPGMLETANQASGTQKQKVAHQQQP